MATHDYNIANQGFPAFRADLNDALAAIVSNNSNATAPATTFAHQWWMDTSANPSILKVRNADNDAWITLGTFNQSTDTFTPSGASSDKIEEGNSKVEVVDSGTGYIVFEVDGAEVARFNPDQLVTKAGTASTPAVSPTGDLNTGIFFPAADTIAFAEGGAEAMRITSDGRLGIGTTSPTNPLTVRTSGTSTSAGGNIAARIESNGSGYASTLQFSDNVANSSYISMVGSATAFGQAGTERARITSGGDFQFDSGYGSVATAYGCRAWVNFNGTGTVAIREDGNVSSITDNGTGIYTVNFTTAMPDANYGASVSVSSMPAVSDANMVSTDCNNTSRTNPTTSAFRITTFNAQFQPIDIEFIRVAIFR